MGIVAEVAAHLQQKNGTRHASYRGHVGIARFDGEQGLYWFEPADGGRGLWFSAHDPKAELFEQIEEQVEEPVEAQVAPQADDSDIFPDWADEVEPATEARTAEITEEYQIALAHAGRLALAKGHDQARVGKAMRMALEGRVILAPDGSARIAPSAPDADQYRVAVGHCDCPDHKYRASKEIVCKHRLARGLVVWAWQKIEGIIEAAKEQQEMIVEEKVAGFDGEQRWDYQNHSGVDWLVPVGFPNNAAPICREVEPEAYEELATRLGLAA